MIHPSMERINGTTISFRFGISTKKESIDRFILPINKLNNLFLSILFKFFFRISILRKSRKRKITNMNIISIETNKYGNLLLIKIPPIMPIRSNDK